MEENNQNSNPDSESTGATVSPAIPEAPQNFGDWLKLQRTQRKVSLEEIAAVTKVHIMQLKALEENEVSRLPAPAFVRGFLVSYARHLHLDENDVLDRYKSSFGGSLTPIADLLMPMGSNRSARSASSPKVAMVSSPHIREAPSTRNMEANNRPALSMKSIGIVLLVLVMIGALVGLMTIGKKSRTEVETASTETTPAESASTAAPEVITPPVAETAPVPAPVTSAPAVPVAAVPVAAVPAAAVPAAVVAPVLAADTLPTTPPVPESPKKFQLEIKAIEGNYVHLRVDDTGAKGVTLKAGQVHLAGVDRKAVLTISDAGNIEIRWNGTWYAAPGFRGDLKVITLPDQLAQLTAKGAAAKPRPKAPAAPVAPPPPPQAAD